MFDELALAIQRHQSGLLDEAAEAYRRVLATQPDHADALHLLGVIAYQRGENVITAVQRLLTTLKSDLENTHITLPSGTWLNRLTNQSIEGGEVQSASLLGQFPVALLVRTS